MEELFRNFVQFLHGNSIKDWTLEAIIAFLSLRGKQYRAGKTVSAIIMTRLQSAYALPKRILACQ